MSGGPRAPTGPRWQMARPRHCWVPSAGNARTSSGSAAASTADGLRATHRSSTVTLGGLLKHLALIEDYRFRHTAPPRSPSWGRRGSAVDWDANPNWEWHSASDDMPDQLMALWHDAVARSDAAIAAALAGGDLDQLIRYTPVGGTTWSLRRLLVDTIEEYARHVGQADLIRESVDGLVGEDPRDEGA